MNNEPSQSFSQPESIPPVQDNNFIIQPPTKKTSKLPLIIAIILGVLLLLAIGCITYLLYFQPEKTSAPATQTGTSQSVAPEDKAAILITKIKTAVNDQLKDAYKNMAITDGTNAPAYTAPNTSYAVLSSDLGVSLAIDPGTTNYDQTAINAIQRVIGQTLDDQVELHSTINSWQKNYQNDSVICSTSLDGTPISVSCANIKAYAALVSQVKPFAAAYYASKEGQANGKGLAFNTPKITKKTNGYSSAVVSIGSAEGGIGGFAGLFYAKDSNWIYWKGTQSELLCSDYNTDDLRRAFEGDVCYDAKDEKAIVKIAL